MTNAYVLYKLFFRMIQPIQYMRSRYITLFVMIATIAVGLFAAPSVFGQTCDTGKCSNTGKTCAAATDCQIDFGVKDVSNGLAGSLGNETLIKTVTRVINVALGLLGIIAVVIILIGGFKWMTAGGNEDKVAEARKMIFAGIIGLAIILSAWAIAKFVIQSLSQATGSGVVAP